MAHVDIQAVWLSLRLAATTDVVLLSLGTPLAWWLAHGRSRWKSPVEAIVALPLVLPPTVLGFYLLVALGTQGPLGALWQRMTGAPLAFSFTGLVIGSVVYSLPFVVQPLQAAFEAAGRAHLEAAWSLRARPLDAFFTVASPMARRGYITAAVLGFAHTLGEFGVVLMVGGNIPGKTRVLSIAIFDHVEALEYAEAQALAAGLLVFCFLTLLVVYVFNRRAPVHVS